MVMKRVFSVIMVVNHLKKIFSSHGEVPDGTLWLYRADAQLSDRTGGRQARYCSVLSLALLQLATLVTTYSYALATAVIRSIRYLHL